MTASGASEGVRSDRWPQPEARYPDQAVRTGATPGVTEEDDPTLPIKVPTARRKQAKHRIRSRHERAGRRSGVPVKPISVSVPSSVASAWRAHSQQKKRSLVDVMLDAVVAHKDRLPEIVRAHQSAARVGKQATSDGLFLRTPDPSEAVAETPDDPYVTVPLRMLSTNVDTLDALAYEAAAESRSQLVVAVLNAYLVDQQAKTDQVEQGERVQAT